MLLLAVASGAGRLVVLGPLAGTVACVRRLLRAPPLPRHVHYRPRVGWSLEFSAGRVDAALLPRSWFGRRFALAAFRTADGRHRLVPLRHPPGRDGADWRRLRVLWRTGAVALVANSSNC
ncbi:MAG: hypothetical protein P8172_00595 [Gammaproteobacteria bacterium]